MYSQLFDNFHQILKQAQQTNISINKNIESQPQRKNNQLYTYANAKSFTKTERFKQLKNQDLRTNDTPFTNNDLRQKNINGYQFKKSGRFQNVKKTQQEIILNPNYELVKKNHNHAPLMKKKTIDLSKSNITAVTATSTKQIGPSTYYVQDDDIKSKKTTIFSKSNRFKKQSKKYEDTPLYLNENQIEKRKSCQIIMKKSIQKNKNLISKEKIQELRQRMKMLYWQSIPLQMDKLQQKNHGTIIMKDNYFNLSKMKGVERKCAIQMLLDRMNEERGGYQNNLIKTTNNSCGVVYRKSTPKPFKFTYIDPSPDYYYPEDDIRKPTKISYTFAKQRVMPQKQQKDFRDYEINQDLYKKGMNIVINPVHKQHRLSEQQLQTLNRGPGFYDCLFSQIQKRNDIAVLKMPVLTTANARQNNCVQIKQVNDGIYYPSYSAIDGEIGVPLYKQPIKIKPIHIPDKQIFPQHWLFYDTDLNKVRAEIAKNILLAKNMTYKEYQQYAKKFQSFQKYLQRNNQQPQIGQYNIKYTQIDAHLQGYDMKKQQQKTLNDPIIKVQGNLDGDNLILHANLPKKNQPTLHFDKMIGHNIDIINNNSDEVKQGDVLILNPHKQVKIVPEIDFTKMIGRNDGDRENNDEPNEGDRLILHPNLLPEHIQNINFQKQSDRPQFGDKVNQMAAEIIINPKSQKKIKGLVELNRMSSVKVVPFLRSKKQKK